MKIAIIGVNTLLGQELANSLQDHFPPITLLKVFDSREHVGQIMFSGENKVSIELLSEKIFHEEEFDLVFVTGEVDENCILVALSKGVKVIDVSSLYTDGVSVIPEINAHIMKDHGLFVNPLPLSVQLALTLAPIKSVAGIKRVVVSIYRAVSDEGLLGVDELERQILEIEDGKEASLHCFPKQIAFNVVPCCDFEQESGWTLLEKRICTEVQNIFEDNTLEILPTCVLVPVLRGHGMSIMVETDKNISSEELLQSWEQAEGIEYFDTGEAPTPWGVEGTNFIGLGRLRKDPYKENCYHFWSVADNIIKGCIHNAIAIAKKIKK